MQDLPTAAPNPYVLAILGPDRDDVRRLISASDLYLAALYPAESNHLTDLKALASPDVTLLAVLRAGEAVGCGALVRTRPGEAELKRMFVAASHRGGGLGRRILSTDHRVIAGRHFAQCNPIGEALLARDCQRPIDESRNSSMARCVEVTFAPRNSASRSASPASFS